MTKIKTHETVERSATIPVTENLSHAMYLRQEIASGSSDDGQPIEISITGSNMIIMIGKWGGSGRQFVVNFAKMATAILEQMTESSIIADESRP